MSCTALHGYVIVIQNIHARKSDCLGCVVLLCLNCCLFDLACFFLPSHFSLKKVPGYVIIVCVQLYRDEV